MKASLIVLAGGFIWAILSPRNEFPRFVFEIGLIGCFINLLSLPHELGHVCAAFITRVRIFQVTIGVGRLLYKRELWGIDWKFHAVPFCGLTLTGFDNKKFYRFKKILVSLGGPLANCLLIIAGIILLFYVSSQWFSTILKAFIVANAAELLFNIVPRRDSFYGTIMQSDGLSLLTVPFMSESQINHEIEANYVWQIYTHYMKGRVEMAMQTYEKGMVMFPDSSAIQNEMGQMLLNQRKFGEARNLFVRLHKKADVEPAIRLDLLNSIAAADVMLEENSLLEEADEFSRIAFESMPWQSNFKWIRGLVLSKKGHTQQGLTLLKEVMKNTEDPSLKSWYASYIADIENKPPEEIPLG
ncbi:MAG: site-2 protease family protein [Sedimentisphaerales bacterium]|nr:site-2 protease family protein [Sedimentisphaerales bacterium]